MRLRSRYRLWKRRRAYRQAGLPEHQIDSLMQMKRFEVRMEDRERRTIELREQAATRGNRRSIGVLLNHLFDSVLDPYTGELFTSARIAQISEGRFSKDWIQAVRESRDVRISRSDLITLGAFFGVAGYYWQVGVEPDELDSEVREARDEHQAAKRYPEEGDRYAGYRLFMSDLSDLVEPEGQERAPWTPEDIEQATHGKLNSNTVRELLDADEPSPKVDHMKALAEHVLDQPAPVWVERYFMADMMNNLIR